MSKFRVDLSPQQQVRLWAELKSSEAEKKSFRGKDVSKTMLWTFTWKLLIILFNQILTGEGKVGKRLAKAIVNSTREELPENK